MYAKMYAKMGCHTKLNARKNRVLPLPAELSRSIHLGVKEQRTANTWALIKQGLLEGSMIISYYLFYHDV